MNQPTKQIPPKPHTHTPTNQPTNQLNQCRPFRLWIVPKDSSDPQVPQQIGYYNVVPACVSTGGVFSMPEFEPFNMTIEKVNEMFRQNPLQGMLMGVCV